MFGCIMGDVRAYCRPSAPNLLQAPRPRGARRQPRLQPHRHGVVSIHAPARGATLNTHLIVPTLIAVSIHAPARGAAGRVQLRHVVPAAVSIHAPARGATSARPPCAWRSQRFNPRARAGRDRSRRKVRAAASRFNPRARAGRDFIQVTSFAWPEKFQSTCPRGARRGRRGGRWQLVRVSIHAPARGATSARRCRSPAG